MSEQEIVVVNVLHEDNTPKTPEEVEHERQQIIAEGKLPIVPGSQTDSALLLKSLQEEREKRRIAENKLAERPPLTTTPPSPSVTTEEGKVLKEEIDGLKHQNALKDLYLEHPPLKAKSADFEKYLAEPDNAGMSLATAAKAFMVENGIPLRRPGLEKVTGGERTPPSTGMTVEDIRILRETNFKKYQELLKKGLITFPKGQ